MWAARTARRAARPVQACCTALRWFTILGEDKVHVSGVDSIASFIELWSDLESGFAVQLIARWHLSDGEVGRESVEVQFQEPVELHDQFFTPDAHGGKDRPRVDFSD